MSQEGAQTESKDVATVEQELLPAQAQVESAGRLPSNPIEILATAVMSGRLDVESLKELMALEKDYRAMQAKVEFDKAVAKFAGLKESISHNQKGQAGNAVFTYADYPQMVSVITPWLKAAGLSFSHTQDQPEMEGSNVVFVNVRCHLKARSGYSEIAEFPAIPDEKLRSKIAAGQLLQAAITYAKRQTLAMVLGLSTGEDAVLDHDNRSVRPKQQDAQQKSPDYETITEEQALTLHSMVNDLFAELGRTDTGKRADSQMKVLAESMGYKKIGHLPADRYDEAVLKTKSWMTAVKERNPTGEGK